ncbi:methyltransferase domain-containing protein [Candidatus Daviesbacteria bacterium]|nr:methyltransferase domain-containing protein [Candidatus Daviesbacteria bacterium]
MRTEAVETQEGIGQEANGATVGLDLEPKHALSPRAVEVILNPSDPANPLRDPFEDQYARDLNYELKYTIAYSLIEDGRYPRQDQLLKSFLLPHQAVSPEAKKLRDKLSILLIQKGVIQPDSKEAQEADEEVVRFVDRDERLKQLRTVLPVPVLGAITYALLFQDAVDEKKREKLRSYTTRPLLRPYLRDLEIHRGKGEIEFRDLVSLVPEEIFRNPDAATLNIVRNYLVNQAMGMFIESEDEGFTKLQQAITKETSQIRREFLEIVYQEFRQIQYVRIPPVFKDVVEGWFSDESPFPLFRQKYFVYEFLKTRRKLLNGDTGATKTACAFLAMETALAQGTLAENWVEVDSERENQVRVTIFGPARARNTWPREAAKIFREDVKRDVFTIREARNLEDPRVETAEYVYIGSELLGRAWNNPALYHRIHNALVTRRQTNGVIFDESDEFRKESAQRSRMIADLVTQIRENQERRGIINTPMVALTATPIASSLADLDITLALLYPERFALPRRVEDGKVPFSVQALKDPKVAFSLLYGEQLMIQWTLEDLFGDKAPKLPENPRKAIPMSPSERVLYEWIANLQIGTLAKVRLLRSVLLNPELIKKVCQERGLVPTPVYERVAGLQTRLVELHDAWTTWSVQKDPSIPDEPFSADWIAKFGDAEFLIQCLFEDSLVEGVESLAKSNTLTAQDWKPKGAVSSKYLAMKEFIEQRAQKDARGVVVEGFVPEEQVFIAVPYHKRGITRNLDDPNTRDEDLADNALSLYEYLVSDWLPGLLNGMAINIDGDRSFYARDKAAQVWRIDGLRNNFVVADMESVYESMDWAIRDTEQNRNIRRGTLVFPFWPWGWDEYKQMAGRFLRPGQAKPMEVMVFESENSIDQGFYDVVRRKDFLAQIALAGVELDPEDQAFFNEATAARRILLVEPTVGQLFLQDIVRRLKGAGEQETTEQLSQERNGKTFYELFAEFYFDEGRDEFRIVGNNAELMKNVLLRTHPRRILSIGAGTCLFARKVAQAGYEAEIDNLDINGSALRVAQERFPQVGNIMVGRASQLDLDTERYDAIDCSFMLPWTKLVSEGNGSHQDPTQLERVKALIEINRVLKMGGSVVLSFPESSFDEERFRLFAESLTKHFGFTILEEHSGVSYATDIKPFKRIGWIITVQKTNQPNLAGFNSEDLSLLSDEETRISKYKGKKNGKQTVVKVEYPIFSSKRFKVENPLTQQTTEISSPTVDGILLLSPREMVDEIKPNLNQGNRRIWIAARRRIETSLGRNYEESEEILAGIIARRGLHKIEEWDEASVQRLIGSELNRRLRRGTES